MFIIEGIPANADLLQIISINPGFPNRFYQRTDWDLAAGPLPTSYRTLQICHDSAPMIYAPWPNFELLPGGISEWLEWKPVTLTTGVSLLILAFKDPNIGDDTAFDTRVNYTISYLAWRQVLLTNDRPSGSTVIPDIDHTIKQSFERHGKKWSDDVIMAIRRMNNQAFYRNKDEETRNKMKEQMDEINRLRNQLLAVEASPPYNKHSPSSSGFITPTTKKQKRSDKESEDDESSLDEGQILKALGKLMKKK